MINKTYIDFQEIALYYDELYIKPEEYQKEVQQILTFCRQYQQSPGDNLLDIACGTGGHVTFLKDHYHVIGLDFSEGMLNIARKKFPDISFFHGNMIDFYLRQKFDVIICRYGSIGFVKTAINLNHTIFCRTMN